MTGERSRSGRGQLLISVAVIVLALGSAAGGDRRRPVAGDDTLQLDLGCATADGRRLMTLLSADRITVARVDSGAEQGMAVRVVMTAARFRSLFGGTVAQRVVARSAGDGSVSERQIVKYTVPRRYRRTLRWIRLPDPQLE